MAAIIDSVKLELPFLTAGDNADITAFIEQAMLTMQCKFKFSDTDVLNEAMYNAKQKLIIAYLASCYLLIQKANKNVAGSGGNAPTGQKILKRAKAGTAEAEWETDKNKLAAFITDLEKALGALVAKINNLACPYCFVMVYRNGGVMFDYPTEFITPSIFIPACEL